MVVALDNISQMSADLARQSQALLEAIAFFKDRPDAAKAAPRELTLKVEQARPYAAAPHGLT
ncbi:hypothetical protein D3C72_889050 [compost metagenome]